MRWKSWTWTWIEQGSNRWIIVTEWWNICTEKVSQCQEPNRPPHDKITSFINTSNYLEKFFALQWHGRVRCLGKTNFSFKYMVYKNLKLTETCQRTKNWKLSISPMKTCECLWNVPRAINRKQLTKKNRSFLRECLICLHLDNLPSTKTLNHLGTKLTYFFFKPDEVKDVIKTMSTQKTKDPKESAIWLSWTLPKRYLTYKQSCSTSLSLEITVNSKQSTLWTQYQTLDKCPKIFRVNGDVIIWRAIWDRCSCGHPRLRCHPEVTSDQTIPDQSVHWSYLSALKTPSKCARRCLYPFGSDQSHQTLMCLWSECCFLLPLGRDNFSR